MTDDELIELYESNGVKIKNSDGSYCKLYFEQVVSSGHYWDNDKNLWCEIDL